MFLLVGCPSLNVFVGGHLSEREIQSETRRMVPSLLTTYFSGVAHSHRCHARTWPNRRVAPEGVLERDPVDQDLRAILPELGARYPRGSQLLWKRSAQGRGAVGEEGENN